MRRSRRRAAVRLHIKRIAGFFKIFVLAVSFTGCAESVNHDEILAAQRALDFARVVLIEKNLIEGYGMLSQAGKRHVPLDKFKQTIAAMHRRDYPEKVIALEYEPMAGENAIYIFLSGSNGDEQFSYRVTLEGTANTGYKVLKIDQGMSFPTISNQKREIKPPLRIP